MSCCRVSGASGSVVRRTRQVAIWRAWIALLPFAFLVRGGMASDLDGRLAATLYVAQISSESGWEDVFVDPVGASYVNAYLLVAGLSRGYAHYYGGALQLEAEGQIAYSFGDQRYWEFNAAGPKDLPLPIRGQGGTEEPFLANEAL
jgi:hypothetical protein